MLRRMVVRPRRMAALVAVVLLSGCGEAASSLSSAEPAPTRSTAATHTATSPTPRAVSLASLFEGLPEWPGDPWLQDESAVPHAELAVFPAPEHCGWQEAIYLSGTGLYAPRDQDGRLWSRDPKGVLQHFPRAQLEFRSPAVLPADAADTGYRQGAVELWVAPSDEARYVYVVNGEDRDDVERWVRGGGGCA